MKPLNLAVSGTLRAFFRNQKKVSEKSSSQFIKGSDIQVYIMQMSTNIEAISNGTEELIPETFKSRKILTLGMANKTKRHSALATVTVSEKGQISIPVEMRDDLKIKKGDKLVLLNLRGQIILEKEKSFFDKWDDDFGDTYLLSMDSLKDVWDNKQDAEWSERLWKSAKKK
ncbi:MAG: AbrB/MazE/SpoVT family DNA-binding domain-containing protein [Nanoarchaeota archaeon]